MVARLRARQQLADLRDRRVCVRLRQASTISISRHARRRQHESPATFRMRCCGAWAGLSEPASKCRSHRIGPRSSNISTRHSVRAASSSPRLPNGSNSSLAVQSLRLGFNYQIGETYKWGSFLANGPTPILEDRFNLHGQMTYVSQYAPRFRSPYVGPQSLSSKRKDARPPIPRSIWAPVFGKARNCGSTQRSTKALGSAAPSESLGFPASKPTSSETTIPTRAFRRAFVRQTIASVAKSRRSMPASISSPDQIPAIGWS